MTVILVSCLFGLTTNGGVHHKRGQYAANGNSAMTQWEELASKFLRELAKRDMKVWRATRDRENVTMVPKDTVATPSTKLKSEASYARLIRAARTSPDYMERNT